MSEIKPLSIQNRHNWQIDAALFISALLASLSGIYFLLIPGGYQGGRNPFYGIVILFDRTGWDLLHAWTGAAMIVAAVVHIAIHWKWITGMASRVWRSLLGRGTSMNSMAKFNVGIDALIGLSFLVAAVSGVYFLYFPGHGAAADPMVLFSRGVWDVAHSWSGIVMILAAIIHFAIHWKWVTKVTRRYFTAGAGMNTAGNNPAVTVPAGQQ